MTFVDPEPTDWRSRKKAATRSTIRRHALRLFSRDGYDGVTVEQIAAAAGVSHMTFFRYFPSKEDVVLSDEYDPLRRAAGRDDPGNLPPVERIRLALQHGLVQMYAANREAMLLQHRIIAGTPALRARLWQDQAGARARFAVVLDLRAGEDLMARLRADVVVAACLAAATTAMLTWAENGGTPELPDLLDQAFEALRSDLLWTP
jgi:AcrR family transcriptional regulator